jgi:phage tail-like protein
MVADGFLWLDPADPALTLLLDGVVVRDDGALTLARVPGDPQALGAPLQVPAAFDGPAGVAVGPDGSVYVADAGRHRILVVGPCMTTAVRFGCARGPGAAPGELHTPRGVVVGTRGRLFVADSGNDRVVTFDIASGQLVGLIGGLAGPGDLAADAAGAVYVVERGAQRVAKFDADGAAVAAFASTLAAQSHVPEDPEAIAVAVVDGAELLVVADGPRLLCYALDGTYDAERADAWSGALAAALAGGTVGGVAAGQGTVYVGAPDGGVLACSLDGAFLGRVPGYRANAGALALDGEGRLIVHPGAGQVVRLAADGVVASGTFRIGPIACAHPPQRDVAWQRIHVDAAVGPSASVRLFALATAIPGAPPPLPADGVATSVEPAPSDTWRVAPPGALDLLALVAPAPMLWLGGVLRAGDDGVAPVLTAIRVEHDQDGWLPSLPAVYARDDDSRELLEQLLALTRSLLDDQEAAIDDLPLRFGATTAGDTPSAGWLDWLDGWFGNELDARWDPATRRRAVAEAFARNAARGTAEGLRDLIVLALGLDVQITEPGARAALWQLGASPLGMTTQLAAAQEQGAVLGTTAILGDSHLIGDDEVGAPLFADYANRFCVRVAESQLHGDALTRLRALVADEQPAETDAHVCVVAAQARVGAQATLGVDAIVGRGQPPPANSGHRLGRARVGQTMTTTASMRSSA